MTLPEQLEGVRDTSRVAQTFGVGPAVAGAGLLSYAGGLLRGQRLAALDLAEGAVLAALVLGALGAFGVEAWRRRHRVTLAFGVEEVGVYREGRLCLSLSEQTLDDCRADEPHMLRGVLGLALVAVLFLGYALQESGDFVARIEVFLPGVYLAVLTLSFARTALFCEAFRFHGSRTRVLFRKADLRRARRMR